MQFPIKAQSSKSKIKRGISYGRVSTFDQAFNKDGNRREDASPEAQRSRCADHVSFLNSKKNSQYQILDHISDEGFSGKNTNRPGMSFIPGVPSTSPCIAAPGVTKSVPSSAAKTIPPSQSLFWTIAFDPMVLPRDLTNWRTGGVTLLIQDPKVILIS